MPASSTSPVLRAMAADGDSPSSRSPAPLAASESLDVLDSSDWIAYCPPAPAMSHEEETRRIRELIEQGERDIAAGRTHDADDVLREMDELIASAAR